MITYKDLLSDENIIKCFKQIDEQNNYYLSHGLKHTMDVVGMCEQLCNILNIKEREANNLLISAVLHDISCKDGRENHNKRSAEFAKEYLADKLPKVDIMQIANIISTHSDEGELPMLNELLYFSDKIDLSKNRLEDNYKEKYNKYTLREFINDIKLEMKDNVLYINFIIDDILTLQGYLQEFPMFTEHSKFICGKLRQAIKKPVKIRFGKEEL